MFNVPFPIEKALDTNNTRAKRTGSKRVHHFRLPEGLESGFFPLPTATSDPDTHTESPPTLKSSSGPTS